MFFVTDAIISTFILYCFANMILSNVVTRRVISMNENYSLMTENSTSCSNLSQSFDDQDGKLINVIVKIWTLTLFVIPTNFILGMVVIYRWYKFDSSSEWIKYTNWSLDVIAGNIGILCIALQFNVNKKWYNILCKSCNNCWTQFFQKRINCVAYKKVISFTQIDQ